MIQYDRFNKDVWSSFFISVFEKKLRFGSE